MSSETTSIGDVPVLLLLYEQLSRAYARTEGRVALIKGVCGDCDSALKMLREEEMAINAPAEAPTESAQEPEVDMDSLDAILRKAKSARGAGDTPKAPSRPASQDTARKSSNRKVPAAAAPVSEVELLRERAVEDRKKRLRRLRDLMKEREATASRIQAAKEHMATEGKRQRSTAASRFLRLAEGSAKRRSGSKQCGTIPIPSTLTKSNDPVEVATKIAALECYERLNNTIASVPKYSKYNPPSNLGRLFAVIQLLKGMDRINHQVSHFLHTGHTMAGLIKGHRELVVSFLEKATKVSDASSTWPPVKLSSLILPGEARMSRFGLIPISLPTGPLQRNHLTVLAKARHQLCQLLVHERLEEFYNDALIPLLLSSPKHYSDADMKHIYRLAHALLLGLGYRSTSFIDKRALAAFLAEPRP